MPDPNAPALRGLSAEEAAERLRRYGYNELPTAKPRTTLTLLLGILREPMFLLLIAAGTIYLVLGDLGEALMLLFFVFVVLGITLYQERKTERVLAALRELSSPRALVVRDGDRRRIAGREVVPGDVLLLAEGDRVPADAVLLAVNNLQCDESLLTGESVPVRKRVGDADERRVRPGGDDLPFVYSGSLVVQGQGIAEATATGSDTELGKSGKALAQVKEEVTPLQRETGRLVRTLALIGLSLCTLVIVLYGLVRGDWLNGLLAGITLAMATLPEEFPVVLTVFRRSVPGASPGSRCSHAARRRSRPWARPPCSASTRPARSRCIAWRCGRCSPMMRRSTWTMRRPARCPNAFTASSNSACSRARPIPSNPRKRPSRRWRSVISRAPSTCTPIGSSCMNLP